MGIAAVVVVAEVDVCIVVDADIVPEAEVLVVGTDVDEEQISSIMSSKNVVASPAMVITMDPEGELLCVEGVVKIDSNVRMLVRSIGSTNGADLFVTPLPSVDSCCCCSCGCCWWELGRAVDVEDVLNGAATSSERLFLDDDVALAGLRAVLVRDPSCKCG